MEELEKYLEGMIDQDFDFEREHWDNGNYDDSFDYGVECGEEMAYREILDKLKEIKQNKTI